MSSRRQGLLACAAAAAVLAPSLWLLSGRLADLAGVYKPYDVTYVPSGKWLKTAAGGQRLLLSDLYWLSAVQYIGEPKARERGMQKLFPLVDLVTDLDPRHGYAYHTAGIALSSAGQIDASDRILKKGIDQGPGWWSYPFYIAFNHFFYRKDYATAAGWAERAARTPGASTRISQLALTLRVKGGSPDDGVRFIEELRGSAQDESTAEALDEQYKLAVVQRDFARLDEALARFERERGRRPASLDEVRREGFLAEIPTEPFGGRYYLDRKDGRIHSSARDVRFKREETAPVPGKAP